MDSKDAFTLLGLTEQATVAEVDSHFRKLAQEAHPDKGGSEEEMQRLNLARDVAKASIGERSALVPLSTIKEIVRASTRDIAQYEERRERARVAFTRVVELRTNRPKKYKRLAAVFGAISAAGIFLGKDLSDVFLKHIQVSPEIGSWFTLTALGIGLYSAIFWWFFDNKVKTIEQDFGRLEADLGDRVYYVDLLSQITNEIPRQRWTRKELEHAVEDWLRNKGNESKSLARLVSEVGSRDFTQLLISKGDQLGLLKLDQHLEEIRLIEFYSLELR